MGSASIYTHRACACTKAQEYQRPFSFRGNLCTPLCAGVILWKGLATFFLWQDGDKNQNILKTCSLQKVLKSTQRSRFILKSSSLPPRVHGGGVAEIHTEDAGDARTISALLQSWWDCRPPQCSTHRYYPFKGKSKRIPSTSKKFFFFFFQCQYIGQTQSFHIFTAAVWSPAHASKGGLKHVPPPTAFRCAAISFLCLIYWDYKLQECAIFSTEGVWSQCQIL